MRIKNIFLLLIAIMLMFSLNAQAGKPLWTFVPLTATTLTVPTTSTATVQYNITNQSNLPHTLVMNPIQGITQLTAGVGLCANIFTLSGKSSCVLSLQIDGSLIPEKITNGPVICQQGSSIQCYRPSAIDLLQITQSVDTSATLTASVSTLALSVNCPISSSSCQFSNAALSGNPRTITITNTGVNTAVNVTYVATSLPVGTSIAPASCGNIAAGASCVLTITPGQTASSTEATIAIAGTNTNTVTPTVNVLTYGSVYQSGYLFSMDDTTSNTMSVSGKVLSLSDQSTGIAWDPGCPGACTAPINANSNLDGSANTAAAYAALTFTHAPNTFAVGLCKDSLIGGYTDWYLPAICEMGYDSVGSAPCGDVVNPTLQNIQSNLVDNSVVSISSNYWSSTQTFTVDPILFATYNFFGAGGTQPGDVKESAFFVRCVRQLS